MQFLNALSFCLSFLGNCGLILKLPFRYFLPRNIIPLLSLLLNETMHRLDSAQAVGAYHKANARPILTGETLWTRFSQPHIGLFLRSGLQGPARFASPSLGSAY